MHRKLSWTAAAFLPWGGLKKSPAGGQITLPPRPANVRQVYHNYMVQARDRDHLLAHLLDHSVEAKVHYPIPIHLQKPARRLGYKPGDFPVCERQATAILTLPVHQHLREDQLLFIVDTVRTFYSR